MSRLLTIGLASSVVLALASSDALARHGNRAGGSQQGMRGRSAAAPFGSGNQFGPMQQYRMQQYRMQYRGGGGQCPYGNQAPPSRIMQRQRMQNPAWATPYGYCHRLGTMGQQWMQNRGGAGSPGYGSQLKGTMQKARTRTRVPQ